ncbi:hypothetical protein AgCh_022104 [Apium graveolens]
MTGDRSLLSNMVEKAGPVVIFGDNNKGLTEGYGCLQDDSSDEFNKDGDLRTPIAPPVTSLRMAKVIFLAGTAEFWSYERSDTLVRMSVNTSGEKSETYMRVRNKVPADMRVFSFISSTLHVKQSLLTGDNEAVSNSVEPVVGDVTFGEIISLRCIKIKVVCKTNKNHEEVYIIKGNVKGKWNASEFYTEESPAHQVLQHRDKSPPRFCGKNFKSFTIAKFEHGGGNIVLKQVNKGISESGWVYAVELYFQEVGNAWAEIGKRIFLGLLGRCHVSAGVATRVVHFSVAFQGKKIINNPEDVVTQFIEGLVKIYPELYFSNGFPKVKVVLRSDASSKNDKISVISGSRSGHEPAHIGFMGKGMLTSIICGDILHLCWLTLLLSSNILGII